jgi:broad specificity phosphatase PhoE
MRHGETEWSRLGRHTGRTDLPLTAAGERDARALAPLVAGHEFALVLSSPLQRAWNTCRLAGLGARAERCDDAMEWNNGLYEGRTTAEVQTEIPGWTVWTGDAPGGETADDVGRRADAVIARAIDVGGDVALFAHAHFLRVLVARWAGLSPRSGKSFVLGAGSLSVLGYERDTPVVRMWNLTPPPVPA